MPWGVMRAGSEWHFPQVSGWWTPAVRARGSRGVRMSCAPWQSVQMATVVSPFSKNALPWFDVL